MAIPEKFTEHPAQYTRGILEGVEERGWIPTEGLIVDPFGGTGIRINEILGKHTKRRIICIEIESAYVNQWPQWLTLGDATALPFNDESVQAVITSPPYSGVRFADYNRGKAPKNWKGRRGYDLSAKYLTKDEKYQLNPRNAAAYVKANGTEEKYWELCEAAWAEVWRVLEPGGIFVFNYKPGSGDPKSGFRHQKFICNLGFILEDRFVIETAGYTFGSNNDKRDQVGERVILFRKINKNAA